jgi:hypothetical protein
MFGRRKYGAQWPLLVLERQAWCLEVGRRKGHINSSPRQISSSAEPLNVRICLLATMPYRTLLRPTAPYYALPHPTMPYYTLLVRYVCIAMCPKPVVRSNAKISIYNYATSAYTWRERK